MLRTHRLFFLPLVLLLPGCNQQDTGALSRIAKKVQQRSEQLTGELGASAASGVSGVTDQLPRGLEGRVAQRLRWDSELGGSAIDVVGTSEGVELRGRVRTLAQRRRALMLAESTAGVTAVIDRLIEGDQ